MGVKLEGRKQTKQKRKKRKKETDCSEVVKRSIVDTYKNTISAANTRTGGTVCMFTSVSIIDVTSINLITERGCGRKKTVPVQLN